MASVCVRGGWAQQMKISAIIPTYNRPRTLLQALRSLQEQTLSDFEILVVDNAADSEVEKMVAEFNLTAKHLGCYVSEPQLGLHNARHTSARMAKGNILVFTDDDATFDPGWLHAYAKAFAEHPEMAAAGGPVRPTWEASPPEWLLEFMGDAKTFGILSLMEPYNEFRLDPKGFFFGVNMAIRRDVLFEVGGFNPESFGDIWLGDGESGLNRRLWRQGMLVGYVPEALVYHHIPPQRMTVEYFCRRMANAGGCTGYARFHEGIPGPVGLSLRIARIGLSLARQALMTPARMIIRRDRFAMLRLRMRLAYDLSRIRYVLRLFHDRQLRELVTRKNWLET